MISVGIVAPSPGGAIAPVGSSSAPSSGAASSDAPTTATTFMNPRVIEDPTAGFITQYLSANGGQIVSQTPSATTVAYLRQGLAPDGTVKPSHVHSVATTV